MSKPSLARAWLGFGQLVSDPESGRCKLMLGLPEGKERSDLDIMGRLERESFGSL